MNPTTLRFLAWRKGTTLRRKRVKWKGPKGRTLARKLGLSYGGPA